jgi:hypothetical protein
MKCCTGGIILLLLLLLLLIKKLKLKIHDFCFLAHLLFVCLGDSERDLQNLGTSV